MKYRITKSLYGTYRVHQRHGLLYFFDWKFVNEFETVELAKQAIDNYIETDKFVIYYP